MGFVQEIQKSIQKDIPNKKDRAYVNNLNE